MTEDLTRWAIRIAVLCYVLRLLLDVGSPSVRSLMWQRRWWSIGCFFFLIHVYGAFAAFHNFSHAQATEHVIKRTAEVVGWAWSGGIWINYLFVLFWVFDVAAWWIVGPRWPVLSTTYYRTMHFVFGFIAFNATLVFGPPHWIPLCGLFAVVFALTWWWSKSRTGDVVLDGLAHEKTEPK